MPTAASPQDAGGVASAEFGLLYRASASGAHGSGCATIAARPAGAPFSASAISAAHLVFAHFLVSAHLDTAARAAASSSSFEPTTLGHRAIRVRVSSR